jgi:hypothetical protein
VLFRNRGPARHPARVNSLVAIGYAFVMPKHPAQCISIGCPTLNLREVKVKPPISLKKRSTAILIASLGFIAADFLAAQLLSLSTDSLVAALVLSILFFPVIFITVFSPIYTYFVSDHHHPSPSRAA